MMLFAFTVLCMIITLRMRCHSHEYRIMYVLGIPSSEIVKAIRLEVLYTMLPSIVLSNLVTVLVVFVDRLIHTTQYSSVVLPISIGAFNLILLIILFILMVTAQRVVDMKT